METIAWDPNERFGIEVAPCARHGPTQRDNETFDESSFHAMRHASTFVQN
jgi:hypothetical protein